MNGPVQTGLDRLLEEGESELRGARLGLVAHQASVNGELRHILEVLVGAGLGLIRLYAPEHGLWGLAQDQEPVQETTEPRTGLPIEPLYGETLVPQAGGLRELDLLLCDLQDVGSRYYTYSYTVSHVMEACGEAGVTVWVLDRPNPLGGLSVEGNLVEEAFRSFVGRFPLPNRHGMTIGELVLLYRAEYGVNCDLRVVRMDGWTRSMEWEETRLSWVSPSPNMPSPLTARVYPGTCLVEGTNLSEGRGTTRPFELLGAPYVDGHRWVEALIDRALPGVRFRPTRFRPEFQKWAGQVCGGVQLHVTSPATLRPVETGMVLIQTAHDLWPDEFAWRPPPYEFETERWPIDLLAGTDQFRLAVEAGQPVHALAEAWEADTVAFRRLRQPYLLYP